jgi:hypothetical protein
MSGLANLQLLRHAIAGLVELPSDSVERAAVEAFLSSGGGAGSAGGDVGGASVSSGGGAAPADDADGTPPLDLMLSDGAKTQLPTGGARSSALDAATASTVLEVRRAGLLPWLRLFAVFSRRYRVTIFDVL